jgi:hypothetical protein
MKYAMCKMKKLGVGLKGGIVEGWNNERRKNQQGLTLATQVINSIKVP